MSAVLMPYQQMELNLERQTGLSASQIREMPVCEYRRYIERRTGKPLDFDATPRYAYLSSEEINKDIDRILGINQGFFSGLLRKLQGN